MNAFLAVNLYRGLMPCSRAEEYWASESRVPFISSSLSRDRFKHLRANWSIIGPPGTAEQEKRKKAADMWYKLRPLLDCVLHGCQNGYRPRRYLTIDEQMIAFKGRHDAVVYIPNKPHPKGFKNDLIADSETYVLGFLLSKGKIGDKREVGQAARVIAELLKPYTGQGYILVCDNHYSSLPLVQWLDAHGTGYVGTLRRDRFGFPSDFFVAKHALERGQWQTWQQKRITITRWGDSVAVFLISNVHSPDEKASVQRWVKGEGRTDVPAPAVVPTYQQYMRSVDRVDQQCASYWPGSKAQRWWPSVAWGIINIGVHNAYVLQRLQCEAAGTRPLSNFAFRKQLCLELRGGYIGNTLRTGSSMADRPRLVSGKPRRVCAGTDCHAGTGRSARTAWACDRCEHAVCPGCGPSHVCTRQ
jgi:hypothetical protein